MTYDNIVKALGGSKLTPQQQADNYNAFSKLMQDGVYLPDLIEKAEGGDSADILPIMESAVRDEPSVIEASSHLREERDRALAALVASDPGVRKAQDAYREAVKAAYLRQREVPAAKRSTAEAKA